MLGLDPRVRKSPWRRKWQTTPIFLPVKSQGQRSLEGYSHGTTKSQTPLASEHIGNVNAMTCSTANLCKLDERGAFLAICFLPQRI